VTIEPGRPFRSETLCAIAAVERGLEIALQGGGAADVVSKGVRDIVTGTDIAVEDAIRARLGEAVGFPVVGEERGGEVPADGSPYWLVDPICGTRNFASGTPLYAVNLALVEGGQVTSAVVGDPSRGEIAVAERGFGASILKEGVRQRITASDESQVIIVEDGKAKGARRQQAAAFYAALVASDRWDLRSLGTTLSLPYLAAGRVAAYVVFAVTGVHSAAGSLLATEAGCSLSDVFGRPWTLQSDSLLAAATPELHQALLKLLNQPSPQSNPSDFGFAA
jgi:myo-inositol-1(or 4)-monophosphatase